MPAIEIINLVTGISSFFGLAGLLSYLFFLQQRRGIERSVRAAVEGDGLFNSDQVLKILKQFKDDELRLEALKAFAHSDLAKATAVLAKVKSNVDVGRLNELSTSHYLQISRVSASVFMVIAVLGFGSSLNVLPIPFLKQASSLECSTENLRDNLLRAGDDKAAIIKAAAKTMRERLHIKVPDYDCVLGLASVLLQSDQDNGHGLYFTGEVWMARARAAQDPAHADLPRNLMEDHFFRYLNIEPRQPPSERDGDAFACYRREKGYCAERTAWINHLMAIDYYQQGLNATDGDISIQRFQRASDFLENDLKFGGFDQIIPSKVLKIKIEEKLQSRNAG